NYGQGSSREHAAIGPRYLGLRVVVVKNFARIHRQNLINFGIFPLQFANESDYDSVDQGDVLAFRGVESALRDGEQEIVVENVTKGSKLTLGHHLSPRQVEMVLAGGLIPVFRNRLKKEG
ncbi:MAG: aconitate hydratase, partial [Actinomycetota bacterium]